MIIDASVAFKLVVEEPGSEEAIAWAARSELVAPTLIHSEIGNALWKRVQRREIVGGGAVGERLADMARYIRTVDETPLMPRALQLAIELGHPIYDCVYLALAEAQEDELLTADARFLKSVQGTGHQQRVRELGAWEQ